MVICSGIAHDRNAGDQESETSKGRPTRTRQPMAPKKDKTSGEKSDLTVKAFQSIRQMLFYNEILPGQKIKYSDLASRIGVSITPIIQAMKWLEFRNIVRHETNRGYYVNEVSIKEVREIYDTRLLLEVSLVHPAISLLDADGLKKLDQAMASYEAAVRDDNYYHRIMMDMQFHMALASLADCAIQLNMLQELFDMLLLRYSRNLFFISVMDTSPPEHAVIADRLKAGDAPGLQKALTDHIVHVRDHIIKEMSRLEVGRKLTF